MASLKHIITRTILRFEVGKFKSGEISLPGDLKKVTNILICLPPELRRLTTVKDLLPNLNQIFADADISLLSSPGSSIYNIFPRKGFRIMSPAPNQLTWGGMAKKNYRNILRQNNYDLLLDMNLSANYFTQSILLSFPDAIRIGVANNLGQPYYNIEIKTRFLRDEKNIYKSMIETVDRLINSEQTAIDNSTS